jgi:ATP-dependent exoDNAse (exonuclease V) alpha subunit
LQGGQERVLIVKLALEKESSEGNDPLILSAEQRAVYERCVNSEKNLCIIQGRAGVGKSTVLKPIRVAHEEKGFRVLGLAPTHKVAQDLKADGFDARTCHSFLFAFKNNRETLDSKTLVVVDEAGMLGTELSVELFNVIKTSGAKLILVGDDRQLSAVQRGGLFGHLAERYGAVELKEVRRQSVSWQKALSEELSRGDVKSAVSLMEDNKVLQWKDTKEEALVDILKDWAKESLNSQGTRLILAQRNVDVDALNQGARDILKEQGRLGGLEITCLTQRGKASFAIGDRVQFTKKDKGQGLTNADFGVIQHIDPQTKKLTVLLDNKEQKEVNPYTYDGLRHGYASTVYKAQGSTLEHVYVLHSKSINKAVNYVALTRQTKSLSLYVPKRKPLLNFISFVK